MRKCYLDPNKYDPINVNVGGEKYYEPIDPIDPNKYTDKKHPCLNPEHNPPTHLYIPPGQTYEHICPGCGKKTTMHGSPIIW